MTNSKINVSLLYKGEKNSDEHEQSYHSERTTDPEGDSGGDKSTGRKKINNWHSILNVLPK
jgi:hypothetical protein